MKRMRPVAEQACRAACCMAPSCVRSAFETPAGQSRREASRCRAVAKSGQRRYDHAITCCTSSHGASSFDVRGCDLHCNA